MIGATGGNVGAECRGPGPPFTARPALNGSTLNGVHTVTLGALPAHVVYVEPTESGARWSAKCTCGYRSTTRINDALALEAAVHHLRVTEQELRRNGVRLPTGFPASTIAVTRGAYASGTRGPGPDAGKRSQAS